MSPHVAGKGRLNALHLCFCLQSSPGWLWLSRAISWLVFLRAMISAGFPENRCPPLRNQLRRWHL